MNPPDGFLLSRIAIGASGVAAAAERSYFRGYPGRDRLAGRIGSTRCGLCSQPGSAAHGAAAQKASRGRSGWGPGRSPTRGCLHGLLRRVEAFQGGERSPQGIRQRVRSDQPAAALRVAPTTGCEIWQRNGTRYKVRRDHSRGRRRRVRRSMPKTRSYRLHTIARDPIDRLDLWTLVSLHQRLQRPPA